MKCISLAVLVMVLAAASAQAGPGCGGCAKPCGGQTEKQQSTKLVTLAGDTIDLVQELAVGPRVLFTFAPDSAGKLVAAAVQRAAQESGDSAVTLLGVVCGSRQLAVKAQEELALDFPLVLDQGCVGSKVLGLAYCPGATFVNQEGQIAGRAYVFTPEILAQGFAAIRKPAGETDPVCKMTVTPKTAAGSYVHKGKTYYFCSKACRAAFAKNPAKYLQN